MSKNKVDIRIHDNGGLASIVGLTKKGRTWMEMHVGYEAWQGSPEFGIWSEGRYAHDIADGARDAGLQVEES